MVKEDKQNQKHPPQSVMAGDMCKYIIHSMVQLKDITSALTDPELRLNEVSPAYALHSLWPPKSFWNPICSKKNMHKQNRISSVVHFVLGSDYCDLGLTLNLINGY